MVARIDEAKANADTLGGVIEVIAYGVPAGIGTYVESDRRLDAAWPPRSWASGNQGCGDRRRIPRGWPPRFHGT